MMTFGVYLQVGDARPQRDTENIKKDDERRIVDSREQEEKENRGRGEPTEEREKKAT